MKKYVTKYAVKELAKLAGVSVRSLHHYDQIGLLNPAFRSEKNYRYYGRAELLRLQQILFYKELDFSLNKIAEILDDPAYDLRAALQFHKKELRKKKERLERLLLTIDKSIIELKTQKEMMTDKEIYAGFSDKEKDAMRKEVNQRWGAEELEKSEDRIRQIGEKGWEDHKKKGEEINRLLADLMDLPASDGQVQQAIALHHKHLKLFSEVSTERYLDLAKMYVEDKRFYAHYDKYRKGLAHFIEEAVICYCVGR